ncbi:hypothetical protein [Paraburkholderia bannensis]|uniref:hypothetical protein n=1 Tax=Paraburkholderia bannensis TaxID=765414 RepID=UPI002AB7E78F|nr:hypothetical protein [Paraburkholderia bannensis]
MNCGGGASPDFACEGGGPGGGPPQGGRGGFPEAVSGPPSYCWANANDDAHPNTTREKIALSFTICSIGYRPKRALRLRAIVAQTLGDKRPRSIAQIRQAVITGLLIRYANY